MLKKYLLTLISILLSQSCFALPVGFVYLKDVDPTIIQDIKYVGSDNFIGKPVKGYYAAHCILTREAAEALLTVQKKLLRHSLSLKVYDCYRPQQAVDDFIVWSKDLQDQKQKSSYYPRVNKADFFKLGYVAAKSGHTRGSTVDLTIVRILPNHTTAELNMGTHFDFMDPTSHPLSSEIKGVAKHNRLFLRNMMKSVGFQPLKEEWWHFTLRDEPFSQTYFNFPVN